MGQETKQSRRDEGVKVAIVGSGNIGAPIGLRLARAGHTITFTWAKTAGKLERLATEAGGGARAGIVEEARTCDVVLLACRWPDLDSVVPRLGDLGGRLVLDTINPYTADFGIALPESTTVAEQLWPTLAGARPVKAFNTLFAASLSPTVRHDPALVVFTCGDDTAAKQVSADLIRDAGFDPYDLGGQDRVWLQEWHGPLYTREYSRAQADQALRELVRR